VIELVGKLPQTREPLYEAARSDPCERVKIMSFRRRSGRPATRRPEPGFVTYHRFIGSQPTGVLEFRNVVIRNDEIISGFPTNTSKNSR
jgi:hypothetical protein